MKTHHLTRNILATALLILCSVSNLMAEGWTTVDKVRYLIPTDADSAIAYTCLDATATHITIPRSITYDGTTYPVRAIANVAFRGCTNLQSVLMYDCMRYIGDRAFQGCTNLTSFVVRDTVYQRRLQSTQLHQIGQYAFSGCKSLTNLQLRGKRPLRIRDNAFYNCTSLTTVRVTASQVTFDKEVFYGCTNLTSIIFTEGASCASIGTDIVVGCPNFTTFDLGSSTAVNIQPRAFDKCTSLTTINLEKVQSIGTFAFRGCTSLAHTTSSTDDTTPIFPQSEVIQTVEKAAFYGTPLTKIHLSPTLTNIERSAFAGLANLQEIHIASTAAANLPYRFFDMVSPSVSLTFSDDITHISGSAFKNDPTITSVQFPSTIQSIGPETFLGCTSLTSLAISAPTCTISERAFKDCSTLQELNLIVGHLGEEAFANCYGLQSTTLAIATSHDGHIFNNSTGELTIIAWLPQSENADENALSGSRFHTVNYNVPLVHGYTFMGMPRLTTINFALTSDFTLEPPIVNCPRLSAITMAASSKYQVIDNIIYTADTTEIILIAPSISHLPDLLPTVRKINTICFTNTEFLLDISHVTHPLEFAMPCIHPRTVIAHPGQALQFPRDINLIYVHNGTNDTDYNGDGKVTIEDAVHIIDAFTYPCP